MPPYPPPPSPRPPVLRGSHPQPPEAKAAPRTAVAGSLPQRGRRWRTLVTRAAPPRPAYALFECAVLGSTGAGVSFRRPHVAFVN